MKFKKGEWKEAKEVMLFDANMVLNCIKLGNYADLRYYGELLANNLKDLYGVEK